MNIRSLTRGDGVVIGAAVVLFIASFLSFTSVDCPAGVDCSNADLPNVWEYLSTLMSVFIAGIAGAALLVLSRNMAGRKIAGIELGQFGLALTIFALWTMFWTIIDMNSAGAGAVLGLLGTIALAGGAIATPLVPALKAPLVGAPRPAAPQQQYGMQPQPQGGYGYPGAGAQQPSFGGQPGQQQPYGAQHNAPQPQVAGQPAPAAADSSQGGAPSDFAPFWFAVPVARPLYGEDGSPTPIAELAPGTWYLAVEQRGSGLVAQTQDGRRGVLQDTSGIQRG